MSPDSARPPKTGRFDPAIAIVAAVGMMFLFMWAGRPPLGCARSAEDHRTLSMTSGVDLDHLDGDLGSAGRTARRYATGVAGAADPLHAATTDWQSSVRQCEAILFEAIAAAHALSVDAVRARADRVP